MDYKSGVINKNNEKKGNSNVDTYNGDTLCAVDEESEDEPFLSEKSLQALREHFSERMMDPWINNAVTLCENDVLKGNEITENWQLSQFWYDDDTSEQLAEEVLSRIVEESQEAHIALIGCPSLYYFIKKRCSSNIDVKLLDIDRRFGDAYKDDFFYYDYNAPLPPHIPYSWHKTFDLVIVDPPFLSEECLTKLSCTVRFLSKADIIVCTGDIMEEIVGKVFGAYKTNFTPKHRNNLANEFACYINYSSTNCLFEICRKS